MPYFYGAYDEPGLANDGWDDFEEIWDSIERDLSNLVFETREEALHEKFRPTNDEDGDRFSNWDLVRYRKSDDREFLRIYYEFGLKALKRTKNGIKERQLSAEFIYYWGMLAACHGYIQCACMAKSNDLSSERAGSAGREATNLDRQKIWFSHYCLRLRDTTKLDRKQIENVMERLINAVLDGEKPEYLSLDVAWFEKFINLEDSEESNDNYGCLRNAFRKNLTYKKMRELIKQKDQDLPPLDLSVPDP